MILLWSAKWVIVLPQLCPGCAPRQNGVMLEITYRPLKGLVPYAKNSRTHSAGQIAMLSGLLAEYGWTNPILIADDVVLAGHARLMCALQMAEAGLSIPNNADPWKAPTIDLSLLNKNQRAAYVIADNQSAILAGWDQELLAEELGWLNEEGFDLSLTAFSESELAGLLAGTGPGEGADQDEVPETPVHPVTEVGDIWLLDGHRLACGDSTNSVHVEALMAGASADLCFTSPPYVDQREYTAAVSDWDGLMNGVFSVLPMTPEAQVLVNLGIFHRDGEWQPYWYGWVEWMRSIDWRRFGWYVWDKGWGAPGNHHGHLAPSHEFIFHFNRVNGQARKTKAKDAKNVTSGILGKQTTRRRDGSTKRIGNQTSTAQPNKVPDSVIRINRQVGSVADGLDHPAVFPVALVDEMITAFSDIGQRLYEPFSGSGTTIISAQKNGRICFAMELAPQYVDVAVKRFRLVYGIEPVLESTGKTFNETAMERPFGEAAEIEAELAAAEVEPKTRRRRKRA